MSGCMVCGGRIVAGGGRSVHELCNPMSVVGRRCVCPPGCTDKRYGDGPAGCSLGCHPCVVRAGQPYKKPRDEVSARFGGNTSSDPVESPW